ncbi:MAG: hypothetical protein J0L96_05255 [Anaerolineae bacterium]|nr:hypothetical protein [Anaerolineae bacterium]
MNTNVETKPGLVTAIAVMTLLSGIINLFWGYVASATALGTIIGVVCLPIAILPTILGVFEIIYAAKLLSTQPQPVQPSTSLAVFQILTFFMLNIFSAVVGILSLVFYNDVAVKQYFARLNTVRTTQPFAAAPAIVEVEPQVLPLPEPEVEVIVKEPVPPAKVKRARKTDK